MAAAGSQPRGREGNTEQHDGHVASGWAIGTPVLRERLRLHKMNYLGKINANIGRAGRGSGEQTKDQSGGSPRTPAEAEPPWWQPPELWSQAPGRLCGLETGPERLQRVSGTWATSHSWDLNLGVFPQNNFERGFCPAPLCPLHFSLGFTISFVLLCLYDLGISLGFSSSVL